MDNQERRRPRGARGRRRPTTTTTSRSRAAGAALRRKVRELRRLVPGGEEAPAGSGALLVRTADYIVRLRARVHLLRALAAVYRGAAPLELAVVDDDGADAAAACADDDSADAWAA